MNREKAAIWVDRTIGFVFAAMIVCIFPGAFRSENFHVLYLPTNFAVALAVLGILFFLLLFSKFLQKHAAFFFVKLFGWIGLRIVPVTVIVMLGTLAYQLVLIFCLSTPAGQDAERIFNGVYHGFSSAQMDYYSNYLSWYPNNQFYFFIMHYYSVLTEHLSPVPSWICWNLLNMLAMDGCIFLTAFAACKKFGRRIGILTLYIGLALLGFSPLVLVPYTDTFVLPFVSGGLALLACYKQDWGRAQKGLASIALGILIAGTYLMKPSAAIVFIALAILGILYCFAMHRTSHRSLIKGYAGSALVVVLAIFLCHFGFQIFAENQTITPINKDLRFPALHFMMLGVSNTTFADRGVGGWTPEDEAATAAQSTIQEKRAYNIGVIKYRLRSYGWNGAIKFAMIKYRDNTSDGSFDWAHDSDSFRETDAAATSLLSEKLKNYYYFDGENVSAYRFFAQLIWIALLIAMLFSCKFPLTPYVSWMRLSLIGILLFLLIFEGGRSKYLIQILPVMMIIGALGWAEIKKRFRFWFSKKSECMVQCHL